MSPVHNSNPLMTVPSSASRDNSRRSSGNALSPGVLFLFLGAALMGVGILGAVFSFNLLWAALAVAALLLLKSSRRPFPIAIHLMDIWLFAFLWLFLPEAMGASQTVSPLFGDWLTKRAGGYIAGAFGATLVGYWLSFMRLRRCSPSAESLQQTPGGAWARKGTTAAKVLFLVLALFALYFVFIYLGPSRLLGGRGMRYLEREFGMMDSAGAMTLTLLPILAFYLFRNYRLNPFIRWTLYTVAGGALFALLALGTRFYLGFAVLGALYFFVGGFTNISKRKALLLLGALGAGLVIQAAILARRTRGVGALLQDASQASVFLESKTSGFQGEGLLKVTTLIFSAPAIWERPGPYENLYVFYWWVPRVFWPNKPKMAGYWLIREYGNERGFGPGHSVAGGFSMPALVDFGPRWGITFCLLYGVLLGYLDRFIIAQRFRPWRISSLVVPLLYFGTFFAMRSLQTSIIFVEGVCFGLVLPLWLAESLGSGRLRRAPQSASSFQSPCSAKG